jgi:hypothetical protein
MDFWKSEQVVESAAPIVEEVSTPEVEEVSTPEVEESVTVSFDDIKRQDNRAMDSEQVEFRFKGKDGKVHKANIFVNDSKGLLSMTQVDGSISNLNLNQEAKDYYNKLKQEKLDSISESKNKNDLDTKERLESGTVQSIERELDNLKRNYEDRKENVSVEFFESLLGSLTRTQVDAEIKKIPKYNSNY